MADPVDEYLKRIFDTVLGRLPEDRPTCLDELCGSDEALRARVQDMLDTHARTDESAASPAPGAEDSTTVAAGSGAGKRIAHYRLRRVIARGGMGVVYEAVQEHPHRTVALKLLKPGVVSSSALRRFEYESQILARLRHPHIAQVYEAGTHLDRSTPGAEPVPFFAMEYVPNAKSIVEYAAAKGLGTKERLLLFAKVCGAVHHGHQKGIIHRDLKPENILVDSGGEPKIIDFGVARATDSDMTLTTLQTDVGQLLGTLQYMSPEQCDADPHDLDSRSDVYALGIVLYELLCGQLPYSVAGAAIREAVGVICNEVPARPSTIDRRLRGDLETITLMALAKERERRYQSASDLAGDIHRYLRDEPILARPPSILYQLRKFARRRTGLVGVAGSALILLILGGVLAVVFARRETEVSRRENEVLRQGVEVSRREAEVLRREAQKSSAVVEFLGTMLAAGDPFALGRDVTVLDVVEWAAADPSLERIEDADVEASVRLAIGKTYLHLGELDEAEVHLDRAVAILEDEVGSADGRYADALLDLAWLRHQQGNDEAAVLTERCLTIYRAAQDIDRARMAEAQQQLGIIQHENEDFESGETNLREALAMIEQLETPDPDLLAETKIELGRLLAARGDSVDAERLVREALEISRGAHGEEHAAVALALNTLVKVLRQAERWDELAPMAREAVRIARIAYGERAPGVASALNELGLALSDVGSFDEAESVLKEAAGIYRDNEWWAYEVTILLSLAMAKDGRGEHGEAAVLFVDVIRAYEETAGPDHWHVANARSHYGACLTSLERYDDAERELLAAYAGLSGPGLAGRAGKAASRLATLYRRMGQEGEAARWDEIASAADPAPRE